MERILGCKTLLVGLIILVVTMSGCVNLSDVGYVQEEQELLSLGSSIQQYMDEGDYYQIEELLDTAVILGMDGQTVSDLEQVILTTEQQLKDGLLAANPKEHWGYDAAPPFIQGQLDRLLDLSEGTEVGIEDVLAEVASNIMVFTALGQIAVTVYADHTLEQIATIVESWMEDAKLLDTGIRLNKDAMWTLMAAMLSEGIGQLMWQTPEVTKDGDSWLIQLPFTNDADLPGTIRLFVAQKGGLWRITTVLSWIHQHAN